MKHIRTAILGQGRSGHGIHGRYLGTDTERYKIVAVVDSLEKRRNKAHEIFGCDTYDDYTKLFNREDIDLTVNATPSHIHVPVTLEFLERGFNVLCDKPLASKASDVDKLINASKNSGSLLAIYQQSRYAPYFRQIRKIIDSGVLGRIVQISIAFNNFARRWDWQCMTEFNGGNLLNTGPHPLDQALQLFGTDIMPEVTCVMDRVNTYGDAEDYVKLLLKGEGRPLIDLEISSCCAYPCFTYNIQGSRGGLKGTMKHIDWKYFKPDELEERKLIKEPIENEKGKPSYCREQIEWYEKSWDLPDSENDSVYIMAKCFYDMLYKTLSEGEPLDITPEEVRQQISVIEECQRQNAFIWSNK